MRGLNAFRKLGVQVPRILSFHTLDNNAELVISEVSGVRPLDQALAENEVNRADIVRNLARVIASIHRRGWTHGALYPAHILVGEADNRITLIDLERPGGASFVDAAIWTGCFGMQVSWKEKMSSCSTGNTGSPLSTSSFAVLTETKKPRTCRAL